jgi:hypothetical protein
MTFDDMRAANPHLGFALYAMTPGTEVTLEAYSQDGNVFSFTGETAEAAIRSAFPPPYPPGELETPAEPTSVFD